VWSFFRAGAHLNGEAQQIGASTIHQTQDIDDRQPSAEARRYLHIGIFTSPSSTSTAEAVGVGSATTTTPSLDGNEALRSFALRRGIVRLMPNFT
jgi:hypothetical protein